MAGLRAERPRRLGRRGAPQESTLHPDVLARYNFAAGRGYDRHSVHEFRSSALAVIDELLAERERGAALSGDRLSDDEQAMLAAFRLLDDERRAELLRTLFAFCAPTVRAMPAGTAQAIGTAYDVPAGSARAIDGGSGAVERRATPALGWPPPAHALGAGGIAGSSASGSPAGSAATTAGLLVHPSWRVTGSWGRPGGWPPPRVVPSRVIGTTQFGGPLAAR